MNEAKLTDLTYLHSIALGNAEIVQMILRTFLEQTPDYLIRLENSVQQSDWQTFGKILHKAKPTFQTVGIQSITPIVTELEKKLKASEKNPVEIEELLQNLSQICGKSYQELENCLNPDLQD